MRHFGGQRLVPRAQHLAFVAVELPLYLTEYTRSSPTEGPGVELRTFAAEKSICDIDVKQLSFFVVRHEDHVIDCSHP